MLFERLMSGGQGSQPTAKPTASQTERPGEPAFVGTRSVAPISAQTLSIEGTYWLVSRTLPDGTVLKPPAIIGVLLYTKNERGYNIVQNDATGKLNWDSNWSIYTLTATEYSSIPRNTFHFVQQDGKREVHIGVKVTPRTPVKLEGGRIQFIDINYHAFSQVFEGTRMTATAPNDSPEFSGIVDVWEKVL